MSASALPPTSTEMPPSPYHSVLQKVSQPYHTAWVVWKPSAQFASGESCFLFVSRPTNRLQKDAGEAAGAHACCLILAVTLLEPVKL